MRKKFLAMLLAVMMVAAMLPTAFAAGTDLEPGFFGMNVKQEAGEAMRMPETNFTLRYWSQTVAEGIEGLIWVERERRDVAVADYHAVPRGVTLTFSSYSTQADNLSFMFYAWSDPDGDGIFDQRYISYSDQTIAPLPYSSDSGGSISYGYNYFCLTSQEPHTFYAPGTRSSMPSTVNITTDYLTDYFGVNTYLEVKVNGSYTFAFLLTGEQIDPNLLDDATEEPDPTTPAPSIAYPSTQTVDVDGRQVEFQMYALKNAAGNMTNYIKVRDLALALNGTKAQFNVDWDGAVNLVPGTAYAANGTENATPFSGERSYTMNASPTNVNGAASDLSAFVLTDDAGGGYTYYQLRDLGKALGFNVGWSEQRGVFLESDKPYSDND